MIPLQIFREKNWLPFYEKNTPLVPIIFSKKSRRQLSWKNYDQKLSAQIHEHNYFEKITTKYFLKNSRPKSSRKKSIPEIFLKNSWPKIFQTIFFCPKRHFSHVRHPLEVDFFFAQRFFFAPPPSWRVFG